MAALAIVDKYQVAEFLDRHIPASQEREQVQIGRGRPGKHTRYETRTRKIYSLTWTRNLRALRREASVDGLFPLLFKKVTRIEANLFVFFIFLILQALIEREVRSKMSEDGLKSLLLYPEEREADRPTTNKIIKIDRTSGDVLALVEKSLQIFYPPRHEGYGWWRANLFSLATMRI